MRLLRAISFILALARAKVLKGLLRSALGHTLGELM